jgi:hypothetical protein
VQRDPEWQRSYGDLLPMVQGIGLALAFFTLFYSLLRGAVVVWDSRHLFARAS